MRRNALGSTDDPRSTSEVPGRLRFGAYIAARKLRIDTHLYSFRYAIANVSS